MKIIRQNSFETNSSSSHSLSLKDNETSFSTIIPNKKGQIIINCGDYQTDTWNLKTPKGRASYLATIIQNSIEYDESEEGLERKKYWSSKDDSRDYFLYGNDVIEIRNLNILKKMFIDVIKEHTGAKEVIIPDWDKEPENKISFDMCGDGEQFLDNMMTKEGIKILIFGKSTVFRGYPEL